MSPAFASAVVKKVFWYDKEGAIGRAMSYCDKCVVLGGKWRETNYIAGEVEFFFLEKTHRTVVTEMQSLCQEFSGKAQKFNVYEGSPTPAKKPRTFEGTASKVDD